MPLPGFVACPPSSPFPGFPLVSFWRGPLFGASSLPTTRFEGGLDGADDTVKSLFLPLPRACPLSLGPLLPPKRLLFMRTRDWLIEADLGASPLSCVCVCLSVFVSLSSQQRHCFSKQLSSQGQCIGRRKRVGRTRSKPLPNKALLLEKRHLHVLVASLVRWLGGGNGVRGRQPRVRSLSPGYIYICIYLKALFQSVPYERELHIK